MNISFACPDKPNPKEACDVHTWQPCHLTVNENNVAVGSTGNIKTRAFRTHLTMGLAFSKIKCELPTGQTMTINTYMGF